MRGEQKSSHRMAFVLVWTVLLVSTGKEAKGGDDCSRCGVMNLRKQRQCERERNRDRNRDRMCVGAHTHMHVFV